MQEYQYDVDWILQPKWAGSDPTSNRFNIYGRSTLALDSAAPSTDRRESMEC